MSALARVIGQGVDLNALAISGEIEVSPETVAGIQSLPECRRVDGWTFTLPLDRSHDLVVKKGGRRNIVKVVRL